MIKNALIAVLLGVAFSLGNVISPLLNVGHTSVHDPYPGEGGGGVSDCSTSYRVGFADGYRSALGENHDRNRH